MRKWPDGFVHEVNGHWVFEDETGAYSEQIFSTKVNATNALLLYAKDLNDARQDTCSNR